MSFKVSIKPSGHSYEIEGKESILGAGLREGLNLDSNCVNGSCGRCKARLLSGQLQQIQHQDYVFSEAEKLNDWFLMCSNRPLSDIQIEAHESSVSTDIPMQHIKAQVNKLEQLQEDVMLLHVRTPRSQTLQYLAGQSLSLNFDGMRPKVLPIASCPCNGMHLRFHVRRREGDPFSELVFERLRKGREVVLSGPLGDFTLDESSSRPLVMVAWETGFASIESIIDHAIQLDPSRSIHLYWASAIPRGHYLSNYCRAWVDALDDFHYHSIDLTPVGTRSLESLFESIIQQHAAVSDWDFYLALREGQQEMARTMLSEAGLPQGQLHLRLLTHE